MPLARDCSFGQMPFFKPQVGGGKLEIYFTKFFKIICLLILSRGAPFSVGSVQGGALFRICNEGCSLDILWYVKNFFRFF